MSDNQPLDYRSAEADPFDPARSKAATVAIVSCIASWLAWPGLMGFFHDQAAQCLFIVLIPALALTGAAAAIVAFARRASQPPKALLALVFSILNLIVFTVAAIHAYNDTVALLKTING